MSNSNIISTIDCHGLLALQKEGAPHLILDVRESWEYDLCHIENSQLIPLNTLPSHYQNIPNDIKLIILCHSGVRSLNAAKFLQSMGYSNIFNLIGGIDEWAKKIDKQMKTY